MTSCQLGSAELYVCSDTNRSITIFPFGKEHNCKNDRLLVTSKEYIENKDMTL